MSEGFQQYPVWEHLSEGRRSDLPTSGEPGGWAHGWQYCSSAALDPTIAAIVVLPAMAEPHWALHESHKSPCAGRHFTVLPTRRETNNKPDRFSVLLLTRRCLALSWCRPRAVTACPWTVMAITTLPARHVAYWSSDRRRRKWRQHRVCWGCAKTAPERDEQRQFAPPMCQRAPCQSRTK